jgi:hypothetical protein
MSPIGKMMSATLSRVPLRRLIAVLLAAATVSTMVALLVVVLTNAYVYISGCQMRPGAIGGCLSGGDTKVTLWYWLGHFDKHVDTNTNGVPDVFWHDTYLF